MKMPKILIGLVFTFGIAAGLYLENYGVMVISPVAAQEGQDEPMVSPVEPRDRDFYAPNSEALAPDEMRVIACGTGMPTPRPVQAAACFLVELGNGDKFLFDIGDGSVERLGQTDVRGFATEVTEFDYKKAQVVYEENGVKITAFPATMRSMAQSATGWTGTGCRLFSPATPTRTSGSWSRPRTRTSWFMNASSPSRTLSPSTG